MNNLKLTAAIVGLTPLAAAAAEPQQPNIILVMCDDLGWGDVGFNGNEVIKTPNIDRMAADGVTFDRFYSACAVSSPTRASVLTGRNPFRMGVFNANEGILRTEEVTIPEILKEEGYATGHFGKWHLGTLTASEKDANRGKVGNEKELNPPSLHGYDEAFVTESKVPTWDPMIRPAGKINNTGWNAVSDGDKVVPYGTAYWDINGNKVTDNLEGDDSRVVMDRVLPFIKKSSEEGKPSLSVVWFHTPHKPCVAGPEYYAMYEGYKDDFRNYAGCVTAMDDQIGRLRDFLESEGLMENTIIWFCSDNGPENCTQDGGGVTGGFRERKRSLYEGGVRVPAFAFGAGVTSGVRTSFPAVTCDYLPTIVASLGIDKGVAKYELDGVDLTSIISGGKLSKRKESIVLSYAGQISYTIGDFKIYKKGEKEECYNIVDDPYETNPMPITKKQSKMLRAMMERIQHYRDSFEGEEYGTQSFDMMGQSWEKNSKL
ncbi:MAG: sulfatase-like hydrolase/transferase [Rikenellaceae bacterium]